MLFLVSVSLLLSLEVLQGDLLHGVSLTLLFLSSLLPLACHGALNTLSGRKKSHNRNIQSRGDRGLERWLSCTAIKSDYSQEPLGR